MSLGPTKIPPQQIPGQTPPAKPAPTPNVILTKLPADLADTKRVIEIKGQVIRNNRDGTVQIRTERGDIEVRVDSRDVNVRPGDKVEIEIPPGRPPQTARVTPDTQTQIPPTAPPPRPTQTPVNVDVRPAEPPAQAPAPPTLAEGQTVRLQPLTPEELQQYASLPPEIIATSLPEVVAAAIEIIAQNAESILAAQVANLAAPQGQTILAANQSNISLNTPAGVTPPLFTASAEIISGLPQPFNPISIQTPQAGQNFDNIQLTAAPLRAQIASLDPNAISPAIVTPKVPPAPITPQGIVQSFDKPLILQNQKAAEIPAVIVGATPQNLPIIGLVSPLTGEQSFFIMHMPSDSIVPGTQITLVPQQNMSATNVPITANVMFSPVASWFLTPEPWPLMDEIQQSLAQIVPQVARAMANVTPSPNNPAQLGPAALFFIAAVRGGDLTEWLGNNAVDALRRGGKSGLLSRLGQEGSSLNKMSSDPISQDWRGMTLPMMWDNQMHKIALYYKQDSQPEKDDPQGKQMRFIFDLSLDTMGKVQLDGLFRNKRLDLIIRTLQPFSVPMQHEMRRIYAGALGETQIIGDLSFQNNPEQWVMITPEEHNLGVSI